MEEASRAGEVSAVRFSKLMSVVLALVENNPHNFFTVCWCNGRVARGKDVAGAITVCVCVCVCVCVHINI